MRVTLKTGDVLQATSIISAETRRNAEFSKTPSGPPNECFGIARQKLFRQKL